MNSTPAVFVENVLSQLPDVCLTQTAQLSGLHRCISLRQADRATLLIDVYDRNTSSCKVEGGNGPIHKIDMVIDHENGYADETAEKWIKKLQYNVRDFKLDLLYPDIDQKLMKQAGGWKIQSFSMRYELTVRTFDLLLTLTRQQKLREVTLRNVSESNKMLRLAYMLLVQPQFRTLTTQYFSWPVREDWERCPEMYRGKRIVYNTWMNMLEEQYSPDFVLSAEYAKDGEYTREFRLEKRNGYCMLFKCSADVNSEMRKSVNRVFTALCQKKELIFM